ncbi:hypothetical protein A5697_22175 [Mycobacterium sp. E3251]|nr:hypothetical protein A5697_22175 [Mycobacterium sp. E3251]
MTLTMYVFLWPRPGMDEALSGYEDTVLALVPEHNGEVLRRDRTDGAGGRPLEIHLIEWASQAAMDGYMVDARRTALAAERDAAIARTEIVPVRTNR